MTRNKKVAFQIDDLEIELEVTATVSPGFPGRGPSMSHAGGEPPEGPEVQDLYVGVIIGGRSIDVTDKVPQKVIDAIEERIFERVEEDEADDADRAYDRMRDGETT